MVVQMTNLKAAVLWVIAKSSLDQAQTQDATLR
jgi:hypothetical protein